MRALPWEWWKLSAYWLWNPAHRRPPLKRSLFGNSLPIAFLGLSIGVAALSLTLAIVSGFEKTLGVSIARVQGDLIYNGSNWRDFAKLRDWTLRAPPGIESLDFLWAGQGLLVSQAEGRGILIEGRRHFSLEDLKKSEALPALPTPEFISIDLGKALAENLKVKEGDRLRLLLPHLLHGALQVQVRRLLSVGMYEIDSRWASLDDAQLRAYLQRWDPEALNKRPGDYRSLRFFFRPQLTGYEGLENLDRWKQDFRRILESDSDGDWEADLRSWHDQRATLFSSISLDKKILSVILSLLTLVAALNVAATLVILFLERDREIALLQAMGLTRAELIQWVGLQGFLVGLTASGFGLLMGLVFGLLFQRLPWVRLPADVYHISQLPLNFVAHEQLLIFLMGVLASTLTALFLGWRLSRMPLLGVLGHRK